MRLQLVIFSLFVAFVIELVKLKFQFKTQSTEQVEHLAQTQLQKLVLHKHHNHYIHLGNKPRIANWIVLFHSLIFKSSSPSCDTKHPAVADTTKPTTIFTNSHQTTSNQSNISRFISTAEQIEKTKRLFTSLSLNCISSMAQPSKIDAQLIDLTSLLWISSVYLV